MEMASRLGLIVLNKGRKFIFMGPGYHKAIIDTSLASMGVAAFILDWEGIENYSANDHQYITFCMANQEYSGSTGVSEGTQLLPKREHFPESVENSIVCKY